MPQYGCSLFSVEKKLYLIFRREQLPADGVALPYFILNKYSLIPRVYKLEDCLLTELFAAHLPIPNSANFVDSKVPAFIAERESKTNADVRSFLEKNKGIDLKDVEKKVVLLQRIIRSNRRMEEEKNRWDVDEIPICSPPYLPKCDPVLAERIVRLSKQIVFIQYIRHICHEEALPSIFDGALYGRKSLLRHYISFSPAALNWVDVRNGDSDVICFGKKDGIIDPSADGNIELVLDLKKIDLTKNYAPYYSFFKQRDLAFYLESSESEELKKMAIRSLQITSEKKFLFDSTSSQAGWFECKYEDSREFTEGCQYSKEVQGN